MWMRSTASNVTTAIAIAEDMFTGMESFRTCRKVQHLSAMLAGKKMPAM